MAGQTSADADSSGTPIKTSDIARSVCFADNSEAVAAESSCVTLANVSSSTGIVKEHTVSSPERGAVITSCQSRECSVPYKEQEMTTKSFSLENKKELDEGA